MNNLYQTLAGRVLAWRDEGYPCEEYPTIAEVLEHQSEPAGEGLRYLRDARFRALETYWYLRLVEGTPHVFDLYRALYGRPLELLEALDLTDASIKDLIINEGLEALWERVRTNAAPAGLSRIIRSRVAGQAMAFTLARRRRWRRPLSRPGPRRL